MSEFSKRHIGPDQVERETMLACLGVSEDQLLAQTLPDCIAPGTRFSLPPALDEAELRRALEGFASANERWRSFIGQGYAPCILPSVIRRNLLENPGWYSSYTPYQAEISQGRLEGLLIFQELICDLTAMPLANASLLDEASAAAEALQLAVRHDRTQRRRFLVDSRCHPQILAVVATRAYSLDVELECAEIGPDCDFSRFSGALQQTPDTRGALHPVDGWSAKAQQAGCLVIIASDPLALCLCTPPGRQGADIVLGSAQRLGVPMGYGGPYAAFFALQEPLRRLLPGRLIGVSRDRLGQPALRMALQTREQHIRRHQATSNICTAQALLANLSACYALYHGGEGLAAIARRIHMHAVQLARVFTKADVPLWHQEFFDTLVIRPHASNAAIADRARTARVNLRHFADGSLGITLDECTTKTELALLQAIVLGNKPKLTDTEPTACAIPPALQRQDALLAHPVFSRYRSETALQRYLKRLERRDYSLAQGMIPLGSCTMKLNPSAAMDTMTHPGWNDLHPLQPEAQVQGLYRLIDELAAMLCELTGFARFSLQPNAGAQGEYAGLLAIRRYYEARKEIRRYCLIPDSAHGTNAASAVQAGFELVPVAMRPDGGLDRTALLQILERNGAKIACLMLTYPSTYGVFDADIRAITAALHGVGAQVYLDGANFNALAGLGRLTELGADLAHLNLHKTFAIPHGGGGPGVGPLGVCAHLAPYLPEDPGQGEAGAVAGARLGSAGILPISWSYLRLLGARGLRAASTQAIISANYIATRLEHAFSILYRGQKGRVAHECIVDIRPLTAASGITAEDICKRLIDYGLHAPTLSFPVPGTLMIEPTESEDLAEIERFCHAMLAIREEIERVILGEWPRDNNPLVNAPHPARILVSDWHYPYSRAQAVYPADTEMHDKFWPEVGRIDQVWGDRHLHCRLPVEPAEQSGALFQEADAQD